jgi:hypothetical protein
MKTLLARWWSWLRPRRVPRPSSDIEPVLAQSREGRQRLDSIRRTRQRDAAVTRMEQTALRRDIRQNFIEAELLRARKRGER